MSFVVRMHRAPGGGPLLLDEVRAFLDRQPYFQAQDAAALPSGSAHYLYANSISGARFSFLFDGAAAAVQEAKWADEIDDEPVPLPTALSFHLDVGRPPDWAHEGFHALAEATLALHLWAESPAAAAPAPLDVDALVAEWNAANAEAGWRPARRGCLAALIVAAAIAGVVALAAG